MSGLEEAVRQRWLERLDREAFGCTRPSVAAYADFRSYWHARAAWGFLLGMLVLLLVAYQWGKFASSVVLLVLFLLTYAKAKRSALWGWFLFGHSMTDRVDMMIPSTTWNALQADSANSTSETLRQLASRRWATYRSAFAALGNPFPEDEVIRRGMGFTQ